jgi:hypothetical protein
MIFDILLRFLSIIGEIEDRSPEQRRADPLQILTKIVTPLRRPVLHLPSPNPKVPSMR